MNELIKKMRRAASAGRRLFHIASTSSKMSEGSDNTVIRELAEAASEENDVTNEFPPCDSPVSPSVFESEVEVDGKNLMKRDNKLLRESPTAESPGSTSGSSSPMVQVLPISPMDGNVQKDHGSREQVLKNDKEKYLKMPLSEKRKFYIGHNSFVELTDIRTWHEYLKNGMRRFRGESGKDQYKPSVEINEKVSLWRGDITVLEIDAIVNAANSSLLGGGGVDGAIHRAAGPSLVAECRTLKGCKTGEAKITGGYKLPAKYVIHTVGPQGEHSHALKSCYDRCLAELVKHNLQSIGFPCISTGIYGYPNEEAVHVALKTTRKWLEDMQSQGKLSTIERVIFCVFLEIDFRLYDQWMQTYFPGTDESAKSSDEKADDVNVAHQTLNPADTTECRMSPISPPFKSKDAGPSGNEEKPDVVMSMDTVDTITTESAARSSIQGEESLDVDLACGSSPPPARPDIADISESSDDHAPTGNTLETGDKV